MFILHLVTPLRVSAYPITPPSLHKSSLRSSPLPSYSRMKKRPPLTESRPTLKVLDSEEHQPNQQCRHPGLVEVEILLLCNPAEKRQRRGIFWIYGEGHHPEKLDFVTFFLIICKTFWLLNTLFFLTLLSLTLKIEQTRLNQWQGAWSLVGSWLRMLSIVRHVWNIHDRFEAFLNKVFSGLCSKLCTSRKCSSPD